MKQTKKEQLIEKYYKLYSPPEDGFFKPMLGDLIDEVKAPYLDLIERQQKRIKTLKELKEIAKSDSENVRLEVKLGCYKAFLHDLKSLNDE